MKTKSIFSNVRLSKALIGMSQTEFEALLPSFTASWKEIHAQIPARVRKICGGKKGKLPHMEDKLAFILLYLKCYPTYDLLGFLTQRDRTRCCRSVQTMLPILEMALGRQ